MCFVSIIAVGGLMFVDVAVQLFCAIERVNLLVRAMDQKLERVAAHSASQQPLPPLVVTDPCRSFQDLTDLENKVANAEDRAGLVLFNSFPCILFPLFTLNVNLFSFVFPVILKWLTNCDGFNHKYIFKWLIWVC